MLGAERQNCVKNETSEVHGTRADHRQSTTGGGELQHQFAIGAEFHLLQYCNHIYLSKEISDKVIIKIIR